MLFSSPSTFPVPKLFDIHRHNDFPPHLCLYPSLGTGSRLQPTPRADTYTSTSGDAMHHLPDQNHIGIQRELYTRGCVYSLYHHHHHLLIRTMQRLHPVRNRHTCSKLRWSRATGSHHRDNNCNQTLQSHQYCLLSNR